jgi:hypothetical protein
MDIEEITTAIAALPEPERRRLYRELERRKAGDSAASQPQETRSAHERAKDLIGPGSGLGDLSTNPTYLNDFGGTRDHE